MKQIWFVCLFLCLVSSFLLSQSHSAPSADHVIAASPATTHADPKAQARIVESYGKLPLSFEANHGQTDPSVKFLSRTGAYSLFLTGDEAVFTLRGSAAKESSPQRLKPASFKVSSSKAETMPLPKTVRGSRPETGRQAVSSI